jgi:tripartite-type tricarboxylate transporter receptor subunit TctC
MKTRVFAMAAVLSFGTLFDLAPCRSMSNANAQAYPTRPITMVVPFPAGGARPASS